jgi:Hemerythrin HHE cation binding domain
MADIIELVLADHSRIRRLMGALDNAARYRELGGGGWVVAQAWHRLAGLLDVHTAAEAEIWYPAVSGMELPAGAGLRSAIAGHDRIRAALQQVGRHDIGSRPWWSAVTVLLRECSGHLDGLEPGALSDLSGQLTPTVRITLGDQWDSFVATRARAGLRPPAGQRLR